MRNVSNLENLYKRSIINFINKVGEDTMLISYIEEIESNSCFV